MRPDEPTKGNWWDRIRPNNNISSKTNKQIKKKKKVLASTRKGNWWDQAKVIVLLQTGDSNTTALLNVTGKYTFHRNTNTNTKANTNTNANTI